jgi:hypothetical protein
MVAVSNHQPVSGINKHNTDRIQNFWARMGLSLSMRNSSFERQNDFSEGCRFCHRTDILMTSDPSYLRSRSCHGDPKITLLAEVYRQLRVALEPLGGQHQPVLLREVHPA